MTLAIMRRMLTHFLMTMIDGGLQACHSSVQRCVNACSFLRSSGGGGGAASASSSDGLPHAGSIFCEAGGVAL